MRVDKSARSGGIIQISLIFYSMKVHTIYRFQYKKENHTKLVQFCSQGIFSKGLKHEFETAVVNEPSVFEPLKFYCMSSSPKYTSANSSNYRFLNLLSVAQNKDTRSITIFSTPQNTREIARPVNVSR